MPVYRKLAYRYAYYLGGYKVKLRPNKAQNKNHCTVRLIVEVVENKPPPAAVPYLPIPDELKQELLLYSWPSLNRAAASLSRENASQAPRTLCARVSRAYSDGLAKIEAWLPLGLARHRPKRKVQEVMMSQPSLSPN